jgi:thiol:disulfide interchange protein DsbC
MHLIRLFAAATLGLSCAFAVADDADQAIRKTLQAVQPDLPIEAIAESPMPGVYQVQLAGGRQLYASADGQFLLQGYLFQFKDGQAVNLTEQAESQGVAKTINAIPASEMVIFSGKQPKTHITVFTDSDCGYCQKLHSEVPELNRLGVEVLCRQTKGYGPGQDAQARARCRVCKPGGQAVRPGSDDRCYGYPGHRAGQW